MRTFSSIHAFNTSRFGLRRATCMSNGAQSGGSGGGMELPPRKKFLKPVIRVLREMGGLGEKREVVSRITEDMKFSDSQIARRTESGNPLIDNRIAFAREILTATDYILRGGKRGWWKLTNKGQSVKLDDFDEDAVDREGVKKIREKSGSRAESEEPPEQSPEEKVAGELLQHLKESVSSDGFELLCKQLLQSVGFIGVNVTETKPYRGDGGFDGTGKIRFSPSNPFVTTSIAFECKKYARARVDVNAVRKLQAKIGVHNVAEKGVIITTSDFKDTAREEAKSGNVGIELIGGAQLAELMVANDIGIKKVGENLEVDKEFFDQYKEE